MKERFISLDIVERVGLPSRNETICKSKIFILLCVQNGQNQAPFSLTGIIKPELDSKCVHCRDGTPEHKRLPNSKSKRVLWSAA